MPTDTGAGAGSLSPSLLSAALPLPRPFAAASAHRQHRRQHHRHGSASARHSRFPGDEDDLLLDLPVYPLEEQQQPLAAANAINNHAQGGAGGTTDTTNNNEDAALEAELVRRCMRRPANLPPDPRALSRVQGLRDVKRELEDAMLLPLRLPPRLRRALRGVRRPPRTFLLHGPPGTGKTLLAEAAAAAAGATLLCASPSAVLSKWSGESERAVRLLFGAAERLAPCVVFLDEVDALGASRGGFAIGNGGAGGGEGGAAGGNQDALARRVLTELLVQMSRLDGDADEGGEGAGGGGKWGPVWVFAATNRLCDVDPALLRRFERRVAVPLPDAEGRAALVRAALRELDEQEEEEGEGGGATAGGHALSEADVARVAAAMRGLSGADVRAVARRAALAPVRELGEEVRRRWSEDEGGVGRKRRRAEEEVEEEQEDEDDGSLRLRPVCAGDWEAALAVLFGGGGGAASAEGGGEGGAGADAASG
jgi:SpoVK/Ycf46/Vps4 family AAA+-type ATPase